MKPYTIKAIFSIKICLGIFPGCSQCNSFPPARCGCVCSVLMVNSHQLSAREKPQRLLSGAHIHHPQAPAALLITAPRILPSNPKPEEKGAFHLHSSHGIRCSSDTHVLLVPGLRERFPLFPFSMEDEFAQSHNQLCFVPTLNYKDHFPSAAVLVHG